MKLISWLLIVFAAQMALAQDLPQKHPRVVEVEEKLRDEASRYFARRFPGEPFFIRVDVNPLRRITKANGAQESLPYFDAISEEELDEWDDPTTPMSYLRNRVTKVTMQISVPEKFTDQKISEVREEVQIYLKLLPFRDEIRVERKFKTPEAPMFPPFFYHIAGGVLLSLILLAVLMRWSFSGKQTPATAAAAEPVSAPVAAMPAASSPANKGPSRTNAEVHGDVTFHDPLKLMDIVHVKVEQIRQSTTFPTLKDMLTLHALGERSPGKLGALIACLPPEWQRDLFAIGKGDLWLEAFAHPGGTDHDVLLVLDKLTRERQFTSASRDSEDLLIQLWRMGDKAVSFLRKLEQDQAFYLLNQLPKSLSLSIAKKAFPGVWGRLLDNRSLHQDCAADTIKGWLRESHLLAPKAEWKLLESYRKDKEILAYLDHVSIDDEKDIYESLSPDSFVFEVRSPFYKIFELEEAQLTKLISKFPLEKWALVVMNSSRTYIKAVSDVLDDKKRVVFSNHLRHLDLAHSRDEQIQWRKTLVMAARDLFPGTFAGNTPVPAEQESAQHAKTA